jgi:hypothetical protein
MDIHKPKPWHNVREFLKEYLIIVVGVLTALGAEQAVEWVHLRHETSEAREALRTEIEHNLMVMAANTQQDACMHPFLKRVVAWTEGEPRPPAVAFFFNNLQTTAWDTARTGAVAQMPITDRMGYARFYDRVTIYNNLVDREWTIVTGIGARWRMGTLSPADAHALQLDALSYDGLLRIKLAQEPQFEAIGRDLKIKTPAVPPGLGKYVASVCALATAPPAGPAKPTDGF